MVIGEEMLVVTWVVVADVAIVVVNDVTGVLHDTGINDVDGIAVFGPTTVVEAYKVNCFQVWMCISKVF